MALRFGPVLLLLLLIMVVAASAIPSFEDDLLDVDCIEQGQCSAMSGHAFIATGSANVRRGLARGQRHISYGAMRKNNVPCNRRGRSYYNCGASGRANPYKRGCNAITRCARATG